MSNGERGRRSARGFTYVGLLALLVLIGLMLAAAGQVVATTAQRERETQLLWVGHEYRAAIGRYWSRRRVYPQTLQELLGAAPDAPLQVRYLRRLYPDPMTNAVDWVLVRAPDGGIMGISSNSKRAPLKTGHFDVTDKSFEEASAYSDWQFTFLPAMARRRTPPRPRRRAPRAPTRPRSNGLPPAGARGRRPAAQKPES
jgi:type II secretory pathway pseudopilin PulG